MSEIWDKPFDINPDERIINGICYRRADLPPEGMMERWAVIWENGTTLIRDTKLEAIAMFDEDFGDCRVVRIFVPEPAVDAALFGVSL